MIDTLLYLAVIAVLGFALAEGLSRILGKAMDAEGGSF